MRLRFWALWLQAMWWDIKWFLRYKRGWQFLNIHETRQVPPQPGDTWERHTHTGRRWVEVRFWGILMYKGPPGYTLAYNEEHAHERPA